MCPDGACLAVCRVRHGSGVLWHAGFPLFVIGYALLKDGDPSKRFWRGTPRAAIALSVALTAAVVSVAAFVCIAGEALLPRMAFDSLHFSSQWPYLVGAPIALANVSALIVLWIRRRSMLDLWLMVVMFLYLIEVPLSYYPDPSRFSVGWYSVRIFGFLSSSLVLIVLLYEIETLYARLLGAVLAQRREREARLMTGDAVAASIAHEVKQPLTAMVTSADAGFRFLDRSTPNLDRAKEAFKLIAADGHRAGEVVENIRANFRSDVRTQNFARRQRAHPGSACPGTWRSGEAPDTGPSRAESGSCRRCEEIESSCSRCFST